MKKMLVLCAGALLASWLCPAAAETASCSGGSVVVQDQTFSNVTATCVASNSMELGPAVRIAADADVVFAAPRIVMKPGLRVERGAVASFRHISGQPRNQAVLGPLVGSSIAAYRLDDLATPIETTTGLDLRSRLALAGSFSLALAGIPADEWILVTASGGKDIDADDSGSIDPEPTANNGTIHALARAADWRAGGLRINALTDIAWRYTADWIGKVSLEALGQRLNDVARTLVREDINGDGLITADDLLAFNPGSATHRARLRFQFTDLFLPGGYIAQVHTGAGSAVIATALDGSFGAYLTLGDPPQQADEVTLRAVAFGDGRVVSDRGGLLIDSEQPIDAQQAAIVLARGGAPVVLTATPTIDTEILRWEGCDWTSDDLTQCRVDLLADRQVEIDFGQIDVVLKAHFIDLSTATVLWTGDALDVTLDPLDVDLIDQMEGIAAGTYVAGLADVGPFLRRVVGVAELGTRHWLLQTVDATLDEVVEQGTGTLARALTHADLAPAPLAAAQSVGSGSVYLLPPSDPSDTVFRLRIGNAATAGSTAVSQSESKLTFTSGDATLELSGSGLDVEFDLDAGVSFSLWDGLQYFKFIPEVSLTPELYVVVSGALEAPKDENGDDLWRKKIYTFKFTQIKFFVGPVPVWVNPEVAIYLGVNGKVEGRLEMGVGYTVSGRAGVVYKEGYWYFPHGFDRGRVVDPPTVTATASLKVYVSSEPRYYLYSATGPGLTVETSLKASASVGFDEDCSGSVDYGLYGGLVGAFEWDTPLGETKFGKLLKLDKVEFKYPILDWNEKLFGGVVSGCGSAPPVLMVVGDDLSTSITQGESKSPLYSTKH